MGLSFRLRSDLRLICRLVPAGEGRNEIFFVTLSLKIFKTSTKKEKDWEKENSMLMIFIFLHS